ncbi:hypothetical protein GCM10009819_00370 [Agromyces tropicus]|uniref:Uncharacterized protein n=1 Tax=Agromyces tropicus TaxID=555371 RepID=A0ABN2TVR7_9MICO
MIPQLPLFVRNALNGVGDLHGRYGIVSAVAVDIRRYPEKPLSISGPVETVSNSSLKGSL